MADLRQSKLYHEVKPSSEQQVYTEMNQPTFLISVGSGRSLQRVSQEVKVLVPHLELSRISSLILDGSL